MIDHMRTCIKCNRELPITEFYSNKNVCKLCFIARMTYTRNCKVTINANALRYYWDNLHNIYSEVGNNEFTYDVIRKYLTISEHRRVMKWGAYNRVNNATHIRYKKFKFTISCMDWLDTVCYCDKK